MVISNAFFIRFSSSWLRTDIIPWLFPLSHVNNIKQACTLIAFSRKTVLSSYCLVGSQWNKRFRSARETDAARRVLMELIMCPHTQSGSLKATISPRLLCFFHLFHLLHPSVSETTTLFQLLISHRIPHLFPTIPQLPPMSSCRQYQGITDLDTVAQPLLCANNYPTAFVLWIWMNEWMNPQVMWIGEVCYLGLNN